MAPRRRWITARGCSIVNAKWPKFVMSREKVPLEAFWICQTFSECHAAEYPLRAHPLIEISRMCWLVEKGKHALFCARCQLGLHSQCGNVKDRRNVIP
jgi:hypothetical protein